MFLVSNVELARAACSQGVVGTFPALNARTTAALDAWLTETGRSVTPYGVNLIVHRTNPRLPDDLEVLEKHKVPIVITSLGAVEEVV